jgi:hypothetical protein
MSAWILENLVDTKRCSKCGEDMPLQDFHKCKKHKDGLAYKCKPCAKHSNHKYREENREAIKKKKATFYQRDKHITLPAFRAKYKEDAELRKRISESGKVYREENREAVLAQKRAYYAKRDKEELNRKNKEYRSKNKELVLEQEQNQRNRHKARIHAQQTKWTKANYERITEEAKQRRKEKPEQYAAMDKRYRENNKDNVREIKQRYVDNNQERREESIKKHAGSYTYAKTQLKNASGVKNPPQELVELKRVQLKIHREINRGSKI